MTYIPRRDITSLIPNKFEAIRVLALECRRLNDEIRAREDAEVEGKLTTLAVKQMLEGRVTYYDAKERREQERSEAMLSAAEGLLDMAEPILDEDFEAIEETPATDSGSEGDPAEESAAAAETATETPEETETSAEAAPEEAAETAETAEPTEEPADAEPSEDTRKAEVEPDEAVPTEEASADEAESADETVKEAPEA
jgi:hypothetical protein